MHLTPEILGAAYEYLRATPPFKRWKMPPAEVIEFHVTASNRYSALCQHEAGAKLRVTISDAQIDTTEELMAVLGHEMIHVHQAVTRTETKNSMHNAGFRRLAELVCAQHGFDPAEFI